MGIVAKIKKDQIPAAEIFFQHTLDVIQEGKLIVFPLDSIYAVGGSAFETFILSKIVTLFDINLPFVPILVVKSLELAQKLVFFNEDRLDIGK